nr:6-hydroxymethylpterin diphosphokinase MptE-like protein [Brachyspira hampsonii]
MNDNDSKKIVYIRHVRASNIDNETREYYDNINISLANSIKEKLMSLTSNYYFAPIWTRNILYNMHFNEGYSIKTFCNILKKEIPILFVSAGASADDYIENIKELSKTHFVIVLSHAFNTLIKNNIKPDAVVSTDGGFYSSIHLKELT